MYLMLNGIFIYAAKDSLIQHRVLLVPVAVLFTGGAQRLLGLGLKELGLITAVCTNYRIFSLEKVSTGRQTFGKDII